MSFAIIVEAIRDGVEIVMAISTATLPLGIAVLAYMVGNARLVIIAVVNVLAAVTGSVLVMEFVVTKLMSVSIFTPPFLIAGRPGHVDRLFPVFVEQISEGDGGTRCSHRRCHSRGDVHFGLDRSSSRGDTCLLLFLFTDDSSAARECNGSRWTGSSFGCSGFQHHFDPCVDPWNSAFFLETPKDVEADLPPALPSFSKPSGCRGRK